MIKIPSDTKQFQVTKTSDLFGNIWYTKNCNFNQDGYVKLSARCARLASSADDSDFGLVPSFGRNSPGSFFLPTNINMYEAALDINSLAIIADTASGFPSSMSVNSMGRWFNGLWHVTDDTKLWWRDSTWHDSGASLTTGNLHSIEVFRNRQTICVGDGNKVHQYDNSYVSTQDLTIPSDYQVVKMAYANNRMGIVTRLVAGNPAENIDAFFFIWDGITAVANTGIPVGSDQVLDIVAYKSSWVILTRKGQLLYFNGAGWTVLSTFPFYFVDKVWGEFSTHLVYGDMMQVDGDLLYINVASSVNPFGLKGERYIQNFPSGIWCYDDDVGLYHRYSPSFSPVYMIEVDAGGTDTVNSILTAVAGTIPATGNQIMYTDAVGSDIGGLNRGTMYYVIRLTSSTFKLALTKADAIAGNNIILTAAASDASYFYTISVLDYGASKAGLSTNTAGGVALQGLKNKIYENLIFASYLNHEDLAGENTDLCISVPFFEARGYFVTAKMTSSNIEDIYSNLFIKYGFLKPTDSIIVKIKTHEVSGVPVSLSQTQYASSNAQWLTNKQFTTNGNLEEALSLFNQGKDLECEIINGAGAGCMEQISNIVKSGSSYIVTLDTVLDMIVGPVYSEVVIDTWKKLGTIDSTNADNYMDLPIGEPSKWALVKIEMRGSDIVIEECQLINSTSRSSQ